MKFHIFHNWSKWADIVMVERPLLRNGFLQGGESVYGEPSDQDYQKRICSVCGKKQLRRL